MHLSIRPGDDTWLTLSYSYPIFTVADAAGQSIPRLPPLHCTGELWSVWVSRSPVWDELGLSAHVASIGKQGIRHSRLPRRQDYQDQRIVQHGICVEVRALALWLIRMALFVCARLCWHGRTLSADASIFFYLLHHPPHLTFRCKFIRHCPLFCYC